ncbi:hypothetical protein GWI33_009320 [Rhynchophorus ferrugineus]|uniref:Uncharacterized protein n=1 Tax=Rhynchophorus ferrugineus TaxID=354439 RepID=A0A834MGM4_RHYFE|nr:hypothetical protein GWI33_009320 [Rhynchophorus ferrugineus]
MQPSPKRSLIKSHTVCDLEHCSDIVLRPPGERYIVQGNTSKSDRKLVQFTCPYRSVPDRLNIETMH